jgi:hypothetical protein
MFAGSQLCSSLVARCVQYRRFFSVNLAYRSEFHVYLQPDVYRGLLVYWLLMYTGSQV